MAKNSTTQYLLAGILGAAIGAGGMFATNDSSEETKFGNEYATVMRSGGILVFVGATPANNNYEVLEEVKMDDAFKVLEAGKEETGKGKFWKKLAAIGAKAYQNVSFSERISKFSTNAKSEYPDADGILLNSNFRMASIIKFKETQ